ncbi:MAG: MBOAT family protein [Bacteroidetes bacterium HGW-Bacteroidetes-21]|nr:MAG: MBOAT family protein [Bacteroidetes bacterium HGW-Bacteroidetes-21]
MLLDRLLAWMLYNPKEPMLFTSLYFWIFFAVVMAGYSLVYKHKASRNIYLFIFSLFFYYKSGGYYFSLLIFSTIVDYIIGLLIGRTESKLKRLMLVTTSVVINLLVLAYFKYAYFFTDIVNSVFHTQLEVQNQLAVWTNFTFGTSLDITTIILPVGISFYTFQTISYSIDVYRKRLEPVKNILDFGFYVSFFPQLVAGPIVRAAEFIPQLYKNYKISYAEFGHAIFLILNGLIKKMIVSDYISVNFVDRIFDNPAAYSGFENLMGVYGYAIQIYCDFSGYTDIAIGAALLLGFRLPLNFNSPYKAASITDFWRRWHISLSSWLRDYLYISLGGNRKGKIRQNINLMLTMLLGGLWHGAHIRFIIWGGIHGLALVLDKLGKYLNPIPKKHKLFRRIAGLVFTFHVVCLAWIFFRAKDMHAIQTVLTQITSSWNLRLIPEIISVYGNIFAIIVIAFAIHWLPSRFKEKYRGWFIRTHWSLKALIAVFAIVLIYQFRTAGIQPFIYFQF